MGRLVRRYIRAYKLNVRAGGIVNTGVIDVAHAMSAADNAVEIVVTSTGVISSGYIQTAQFTMNHSTGAITGTGELHVIALDTTLTGGSSRGAPYWYAQTIYMASSANPVIGTLVSGVSFYLGDLGNAVADLIMIDLMNATPSALTVGTRSAFIGCRRSGSGITLKCVLRVENIAATNLISFGNANQAPLAIATGETLTATHKIAVDINGTTRHIAVGTMA